ncbi:MAG TPA: deoxyguanosinetriphosphate triphosphohydrolase, partial [Deinococcales bacterium]|nr:deoxyguanosinetriphosphate triphosphohydrolase [Deinococcales bacterium]
NGLADGFGGFDHNKQTLRIVTKLERRYREFPGLNLTWETLEGIMKHETEYDLPDTDWEPDKQPGLEAQVVNIADELAYNAHDLDDGLRSGHLHPGQLREVPLLADLLDELELDVARFRDADRYLLVRELLGLMINDIIANTDRIIRNTGISTVADVRDADAKLVGNSPELAPQLRELKEFLFSRFYRHYRLIRMTEKADHILRRIYGAYTDTPSMLPPSVQKHIGERGLERSVIDYLAGMTDRYVGQEYQRLFAPDVLT